MIASASQHKEGKKLHVFVEPYEEKFKQVWALGL
jgi:hypothetical protein